MRWRGGLGGGRCCIDRRETAPESGFARCHRGRSGGDRKSTRLNSSHQIISYAVFCLKKKKTQLQTNIQNNDYCECIFQERQELSADVADELSSQVLLLTTDSRPMLHDYSAAVRLTR